MTTYSLSDLASQALREPGLYAPEETIAQRDQEDAEIKASSLIKTLETRGIAITNGSAQAIPEDWYIPLAQYVGMFLMPNFGGSFPTADQIRGAEMIMRQMTAKPATGSVNEVQFF
jgi:hypothetical protein